MFFFFVCFVYLARIWTGLVVRRLTVVVDGHTHSSTHVKVHFACAKLTSLHTEVLFAECVCISVFERG